jgi:internalin A
LWQSANASVPKTSTSPLSTTSGFKPNLSTSKIKKSPFPTGAAGVPEGPGMGLHGVMKHKSKQILELEKALGFELENEQFETDEEGNVIVLKIQNKAFYDFSEEQLEEKTFASVEILLLIYISTRLLSLFINITFLQFTYSSLENIPNLGHLKKLKTLILNNNLIEDLSSLTELNSLVILDLSSNEISNSKQLLKVINSNKKLIYLDISENKIENIDFELFEFYTQSAEYSEFYPSEILYSSFKSNLNRGLFVNDKDFIEGHVLSKDYSSTLFYLQQKQGTTLEGGIFKKSYEFEYNLRELFLNYIVFTNPIVSPPKEVFQQGQKSVLSWYNENIYYSENRTTDWLTQRPGRVERVKVEVPLNEVRVIFLGQGQTGKTTLKKQLLGLEIPETETQTDGIDIDVWQPEELDGIKLRLWDFGGQEIQHSVHKLFLQDNCVYVLLINKRQDQQSDGHLIYWLNHIRSFGKNSPVLIVENFIDTASGIDATTTPEQIATQVSLRNEIKQNYHSEAAPLDYVGISAKRGYNINIFKEKLFHWAKKENNRG